MQGRIIKALSGFYYVLSGETVFQCRGRGIFRKNKVTPLVGDFVQFEADNEDEGYLLEIADRKNELVRPPIANVDQAILVFSAKEPAFSSLLLDRFLVHVEANHINPVICLSKMDLVEKHELSALAKAIDVYQKMGYAVIQTSIETKEGLSELGSYLDHHITVIAGQSGVGKSSLLNALLPDLRIKTDVISSHLGRGKHTTRHVELIPFGLGLVADTPGFSSLEFTDIEQEELMFYFLEIKEWSSNCKFRECLHVSEPKCAVKQALADGDVSQFRYDHYVAFLEEIKERKPRY